MDRLTAIVEGTEPEPTPYEAALEIYLERLNASVAASWPHSMLEPTTYSVEKPGRKYDRVVALLAGPRGVPIKERQRSVHCFIERETGIVWKADGWKGPTKNFPRGNIYELPFLPENPAADVIAMVGRL